MLKSLVLAGLLLFPSPLLAGKAGIGAWENSAKTTLAWIEDTPEIGWYYNWRPDQMWARGRPSRSVEFVPMIHGRADVDKRIVSDLPITTLLGFNEPDEGANRGKPKMTVEEAIALWPRLERRGLRLGSPATMQSGTLGPNSWLRRFMTEAEKRKLRVDFIAVHYYSTNGSVAEFERWLRAVHAEYHRPIWVTEYAFIDWNRPQAASYAANAAFAEASMRMLERLPFVERHAWFAANPYKWNGVRPDINLVQDDMTPTPLGEAFAQTLRRIGTTRLASE